MVLASWQDPGKSLRCTCPSRCCSGPCTIHSPAAPSTEHMCSSLSSFQLQKIQNMKLWNKSLPQTWATKNVGCILCNCIFISPKYLIKSRNIYSDSHSNTLIPITIFIPESKITINKGTNNHWVTKQQNTHRGFSNHYLPSSNTRG